MAKAFIQVLCTFKWTVESVCLGEEPWICKGCLSTFSAHKSILYSWRGKLSQEDTKQPESERRSALLNTCMIRFPIQWIQLPSFVNIFKAISVFSSPVATITEVKVDNSYYYYYNQIHIKQKRFSFRNNRNLTRCPTLFTFSFVKNVLLLKLLLAITLLYFRMS